MSPDCNLIISGDFKGAINIWDAHTYDLIYSIKEGFIIKIIKLN